MRLVTGDVHTGLGQAITTNLMAITPKGPCPALTIMLHSVYDQPDAAAVQTQFDRMLDYTSRGLPQGFITLQGVVGV